MLPPAEPIVRGAASGQRYKPGTLTANIAVPLGEIDVVERQPVDEQRGAVDEPVHVADAGEQRLHLLGVADVASGVHARQEVGGRRLGASPAQLVGEGRPNAWPPPVTTVPRFAGDGDRERRQCIVDVPVRGQHVGQPGSEVEGPAVERLDSPPASVINREPAPTSHA